MNKELYTKMLENIDQKAPFEGGTQTLVYMFLQDFFENTHTCPEFVANQLVTYIYPGKESLQRYLNRIAEDLEFEEWFFEHWHMDERVDNFRCLYNDIVELN